MFFYGSLHKDVAVLAYNKNWPTKALCRDRVCNIEELPGELDDRNKWKERESQGNIC